MKTTNIRLRVQSSPCLHVFSRTQDLYPNKMKHQNWEQIRYHLKVPT